MTCVRARVRGRGTAYIDMLVCGLRTYRTSPKVGRIARADDDIYNYATQWHARGSGAIIIGKYYGQRVGIAVASSEKEL